MAEQELSDVAVIKVKRDQPTEARGYKCPFLKCDFFSLKYEDLQSHLVIKHGELPKFFKIDSATGKRFSRERIGKINLMSTKYRLNNIMFGLKIYMRHVDAKPPKTKKEKKDDTVIKV